MGMECSSCPLLILDDEAPLTCLQTAYSTGRPCGLLVKTKVFFYFKVPCTRSAVRVRELRAFCSVRHALCGRYCT